GSPVSRHPSSLRLGAATNCPSSRWQIENFKADIGRQICCDAQRDISYHRVVGCNLRFEGSTCDGAISSRFSAARRPRGRSRRAQQPAVPVIGILGGQLPETYEPFLVPFRQGLSEVGFVEGNNVAIESRWAQGRYDRLPDLADVLVSRRVALIYAVGGTEVALAAKAATQIIPIVITIGGDPVKAGLVASLNRPGGNVTGTSFLTVGLGTKRLELLYELVPRASVIAVLVQTGSAIAEDQ